MVGGIIGAFFGVAQLGAFVGGMIGGAIDPDVIKAPSIGDAQDQTSAAGIPRPVVYGHPAPFAGNIIDGEHKARKIKVKQRQGKGGPIVVTERFLLTTAIRICEGPIAGVVRIWRNGEVVYDRRATTDFPVYQGGTSGERLSFIARIRGKSKAFQDKVRIYHGTEDQLPDPALEAIHGVGNTPYYRGTAYMVIENDDVTDTRGAASKWLFEVVAVGDEEPALVEVDTVESALGPFNGFVDGRLNFIDTYTTGSNLAQLLKLDSFGVSAAGRLRLAIDYTADPPSSYPSAEDYIGIGQAAIYDSGWWASDEAHAQEYRDYEIANGRAPPAISIGTPPDAYLYLPASATKIVVLADIFGEGFEWVRMIVRWPEDLGITAVTTPEVPDVLIGSDGVLYYPDWADPGELLTISPGEVTLKSVAEAIAARCDVPPSKFDVTALTFDIIPGLLVAQQFTGADCLRPTQQMFHYDLPEVDGRIYAVKRGGAAVTTITDDDLLEVGEEDPAFRPQQIVYPTKVSVVTQDPAADYAAIPQTSIRNSTNVTGTSEVMVTSPIPFGADEAKRRADIIHKMLFSQAEGRKDFSLPMEFGYLVPSDCINYQGKRWLIEGKDAVEGENKFKAVYDRASDYLSNAGGTPAPAPELPNTGLRGQTLIQALNLPILRDVDDRIGFYVVVSGQLDGWDGCTLMASIDGGQNWQDMGAITDESVMGSLLTALPNAPSEVIDVINTVRVEVNGQLDSITELQLLNEFNPCVVGNEICQFQDATLVSDGVYDLSILTRGRLDTNTENHVIGTRFVLLGFQAFIEAPSTWVGRTVTLRAVTNGTSVESNQPIAFLWQPAEIQTEWAPVQFIGTRDASDNVSIGWNGRGRLGDNESPSDSAFFSGYVVSITKGATTVTKSVGTAQSFMYSAAEQTVDFGSATGTLTISIVAMNRITDASAALTGTID